MKPSRYLEFKLYSPDWETRKTQIWHVISKKRSSRGASSVWCNLLGVIRWYPRWRQYTFSPEPDTVWNPECLTDVSDFIRGLMEDYEKGKTR